MPEFAIEFFHLQGASGDLVELLGVGAVGAFDGAVEFGRARREHEQVQAALLASQFELSGKLAAAIDLDRANGKGHAVLQGNRGTQWRPKPWRGCGLESRPSARPHRGR